MIGKHIYSLIAVGSLLYQYGLWSLGADAQTICATDGSDFSLSIELMGGYRTVYTSGCPHYDWTSQTVPDLPYNLNAAYTFPLNPVVCQTPTAYVGAFLDLEKSVRVSEPILDAIGVSFNGVVIYGNSDQESEDAYVTEAETFNQCNGHTAPGGYYHYHAQVPDECLFDPAGPKEHSTLFGFMADGIPLYGPYGDNGVVPEDLDECSGHVDASFDFYHYHMAADYQYPYTVNCLMGKIDTTIWTNFETLVEPCVAALVQYDYSSLDEALIDDITQSPTSSPTSSPVTVVILP